MKKTNGTGENNVWCDTIKTFNEQDRNAPEADMADVSMIKRQAIFMLTNIVVADANRFYYEDY